MSKPTIFHTVFDKIKLGIAAIAFVTVFGVLPLVVMFAFPKNSWLGLFASLLAMVSGAALIVVAARLFKWPASKYKQKVPDTTNESRG